jgi:hypothetical protein
MEDKMQDKLAALEDKIEATARNNGRQDGSGTTSGRQCGMPDDCMEAKTGCEHGRLVNLRGQD